MWLSQIELDRKAVLDGVAHTKDVPDACSKLIRTSATDLARLMTKPSTREAIYKETLALCKEIKQLIKENADILTIAEKFIELWNVRVPFAQYHKHAFPVISLREFREMSWPDQQVVIQKQKQTRWEYDVLFRASWLPDLDWSLGATITEVNWHVLRIAYDHKDREDGSRKVEILLVYITRVIDLISSVMDGSQANQLIDQAYLNWFSKGMNQLFDYHSRSYSYTPPESMIQVPKEIIDITLMLMPLHMKWPNVQIQIQESDGYIVISAPIQVKTNIQQPRDLKNHSYVWQLDWSYFLQWMTDTFPELIQFSSDDTSFSFRIKTIKNPLS